MRNKIINLKNSDTWKIQLTVTVDFISSEHVDKEPVIHSDSNHTEFIVLYDNVNEFLKEVLESLLSRYQIHLETPMRASDFIFDTVRLMHYRCHKVNFRRVYILILQAG